MPTIDNCGARGPRALEDCGRSHNHHLRNATKQEPCNRSLSEHLCSTAEVFTKNQSIDDSILQKCSNVTDDTCGLAVLPNISI